LQLYRLLNFLSWSKAIELNEFAHILGDRALTRGVGVLGLLIHRELLYQPVIICNLFNTATLRKHLVNPSPKRVEEHRESCLTSPAFCREEA
jgi:hypothetical protein